MLTIHEILTLAKLGGKDKNNNVIDKRRARTHESENDSNPVTTTVAKTRQRTTSTTCRCDETRSDNRKRYKTTTTNRPDAILTLKDMNDGGKPDKNMETNQKRLGATENKTNQCQRRQFVSTAAPNAWRQSELHPKPNLSVDPV